MIFKKLNNFLSAYNYTLSKLNFKNNQLNNLVFTIVRCFDIYKKNKNNLPELNENEIIEKYTKGGGPGGQRLNKATNCCQLKHIPTGI